jgi:hypothetical protein
MITFHRARSVYASLAVETLAFGNAHHATISIANFEFSAFSRHLS